MYILITGESPYISKSEDIVMNQMQSNPFLRDTIKFENLSKQAKFLLNQLLKTDPVSRISTSVALTYP